MIYAWCHGISHFILGEVQAHDLLFHVAAPMWCIFPSNSRIEILMMIVALVLVSFVIQDWIRDENLHQNYHRLDRFILWPLQFYADIQCALAIEHRPWKQRMEIALCCLLFTLPPFVRSRKCLHSGACSVAVEGFTMLGEPLVLIILHQFPKRRIKSGCFIFACEVMIFRVL